jgi:hypothetical protein
MKECKYFPLRYENLDTGKDLLLEWVREVAFVELVKELGREDFIRQV